MQTQDRGEFTRLLAGVSLLYGKPMSKPLVDVYWAALQGFDLTAIQHALQAHVQHPDHGQYLPKPADIVRYVQGDSRTQALQAFSRVVQAMRAAGSYTSVVFDDPILHAVIQDMGGWIRLCQVRTQELPFCEKDFVARYVGYVVKPPREYPKQLVGITAHQNALQGYPSSPPVCIGDPQKAARVYAQGSAPQALYHTLPATLAVAPCREEKKDD